MNLAKLREQQVFTTEQRQAASYLMFGEDIDGDAIELLVSERDDGSKWLRALNKEKEVKASRLLQQSHARQ